MKNYQIAIIKTEIPIALLTQLRNLIQQGWFKSIDKVVLNTLRSYLESHRADLVEPFLIYWI